MKTVLLPAPRARVWRALTDVAQFNQWFGVDLVGQFAVGAPIRGKVTSPGYEHLTMELWVETIVPERCFAFRWPPDPTDNTPGAPMTLVTFTLDDADGGTQLTVVESGFDLIPANRRAKAIEENNAGWAAQTTNIAKFLEAA